MSRELAILLAAKYAFAAAEILNQLASGGEVTKEMLDNLDAGIEGAKARWKLAANAG